MVNQPADKKGGKKRCELGGKTSYKKKRSKKKKITNET